MSKRAKDEANKAFPGAMVTVCARGNKFQAGPILRHGFIRGYEQAEKDTIERACKWLFAHLPILVYYYDEDVYTNADRSDFIKQFRTQIEDEK